MTGSCASLGRVALPPPPSANRLWRTFRGHSVRSADYTKWLEHASDEMRRSLRPTSGRVSVRVTLCEGSGVMRSADLDNLLKPVMDALKPESRHQTTGQITKPGAGIIQDDNLAIVRRIAIGVVPEGKKIGGRRPPAEIIVEVFSVG